MLSSIVNIIEKLQKDILSMQGFKPAPNGLKNTFGLGIINYAFPYNCFPLGAVHEFVCPFNEQSAATEGFISCLISKLMKNGAPVLWIGLSQKIFPPALITFGISPDQVIFINVKNRKEILWVMEESLKCDGVAAVVSEIKEISFTESRRLQLAVEQSGVTGFIIRNNPLTVNVNAFVSRWKITHAASNNEDGIPGVGFTKWQVSLLKIRNGKPGSWIIEWSNEKFKITPDLIFVPSSLNRKAG